MKNRDNKKIHEIFSKYGIFLALIAVFVILSIASPYFLTLSNMMTVLRQISFNGIVALGLSFVIITGGIDLSVGALMCIAGLVSARFAVAGAEQELPIVLSVLIGILAAVILGAFSGLLISKGGLAPFIVTMAVNTIGRGIALIYSDGRPITGSNTAYKFIGQGSVWRIPVPILILGIVILFSYIILNCSKFGKHVYAVGGNANAARASGINVEKVQMLVYIISGFLCGIAGIALTSRLNAASPTTADGFESDAIAAAVIGGTSLAGGRGSVIGTIIGALLIGVIANGLDILNVSAYYQKVIKGVIILIAVFLDRKNNKA